MKRLNPQRLQYRQLAVLKHHYLRIQLGEVLVITSEINAESHMNRHYSFQATPAKPCRRYYAQSA